MKSLKFTLFAFVLLALTSCGKYYYQVYKTVPVKGVSVQEGSLAYEDANCKVVYNLWNDGGDIGFLFQNKTDKNMYINLDESFFVKNGIAYSYYQNRTFTSTTNSGIVKSEEIQHQQSVTGFNFLGLLQTNSTSASAGINNMYSSGYSVAYNEEKIVCIPAGVSKIFKEYKINQIPYRDCDLFRYPSESNIKTLTFTKTNSPFIFSNRLSYSFKQGGDLTKIENEFYVSEITNYPEKQITEKKYEEYCGQKGQRKLLYFKESHPDKFYIKYDKLKSEGFVH